MSRRAARVSNKKNHKIIRRQFAIAVANLHRMRLSIVFTNKTRPSHRECFSLAARSHSVSIKYQATRLKSRDLDLDHYASARSIVKSFARIPLLRSLPLPDPVGGKKVSSLHEPSETVARTSRDNGIAEGGMEKLYQESRRESESNNCKGSNRA